MSVTSVASSFYNPTGNQDASTTGVTIPLPTHTYVVGDYIIAAVYYAQALGNSSVITPTGWTVLNTFGTSSNRLLVLYEYKVTNPTTLSALGTSFQGKVGASSTRVAAAVHVLAGVDLTATTSVAGLEFSTSAVTTYTPTGASAGTDLFYFLGTNQSSPSTLATYIPNSGTVLDVTRALANTGTTADSELAVIQGSPSSVTSSVSTANHVSYSIGLTAAVVTTSVSLNSAVGLGIVSTPGIGSNPTLSSSTSLSVVAGLVGSSVSLASAATLSTYQTPAMGVVTSVASSFYNPTGNQDASGSGATIPLPTRTYVVGDYVIAAVYYAQAPGNTSVVTPSGWTVLNTFGTSSNRLLVLYEYKIIDSTTLSALGTSFQGHVGATGTRIAAAVHVLAGVDLTATTSVAALEFSASAATTYTPTSASSGTDLFYFLGTNQSSPSSSATYTPNSGTTLDVTRALASTAPTADSQLVVIQGAPSSVTSSVSTANHVSYSIGLTAAVMAASVSLNSEVDLGVVGVASPSTNSTLGSSINLSVSSATVGASSPTLSSGATLAVSATTITVKSSMSLTSAASLTASQVTPVSTWVAVRPMYIAHRNAELDWPEETIYGYGQAALWNNQQALEISVQRSSDGVWVASHDQTTGRVFSGTSLDIPSNTWATLSTKTTIIGGYPIARLDTLLDTFSGRIIWVDNKNTVNVSDFLNLLDAHGGRFQILVKGYAGSTGYADQAHARGYTTWGYFYHADVTAGNISSWQSHWDLLGMGLDGETSTDWTAVKAVGKPVIAHTTVDTAAKKATAISYGADGFMVSSDIQVTPQTMVLSNLPTIAALSQTSHTLATASLGTTVGLSTASTPIGAASISLSSSVVLTQTSSAQEAVAVVLGSSAVVTVLSAPAYTSTVALATALAGAAENSVAAAATATLSSSSVLSTSASGGGVASPALTSGNTLSVTLTTPKFTTSVSIGSSVSLSAASSGNYQSLGSLPSIATISTITTTHVVTSVVIPSTTQLSAVSNSALAVSVNLASNLSISPGIGVPEYGQTTNLTSINTLSATGAKNDSSTPNFLVSSTLGVTTTPSISALVTLPTNIGLSSAPSVKFSGIPVFSSSVGITTNSRSNWGSTVYFPSAVNLSGAVASGGISSPSMSTIATLTQAASIGLFVAVNVSSNVEISAAAIPSNLASSVLDTAVMLSAGTMPMVEADVILYSNVGLSSGHLPSFSSVSDLVTQLSLSAGVKPSFVEFDTLMSALELVARSALGVKWTFWDGAKEVNLSFEGVWNGTDIISAVGSTFTG